MGGGRQRDSERRCFLSNKLIEYYLLWMCERASEIKACIVIGAGHAAAVVCAYLCVLGVGGCVCMHVQDRNLAHACLCVTVCVCLCVCVHACV